ncbi:acyltransferase [Sinirhodobacter populi]|uniref:Acyltransferase n=1 Tax=Paenirhodobacter populi TaxID=2306993 RepID=A0A443KAP4_9RHOB|nr:acyltransferase [Sinirhodobacter populi]RWR29838.1 acyltransferase [Sinirhodobacter populi]
MSATELSAPVTATEGFDAWRARSHFAGLDGLRFFAILAVLFVHTPPLANMLAPYSRIFTRGFLGVDFFFVISGFLITTLLLREEDRKGRISLRGFYWRRALRILPLFLLVVTMVGGYYVLVKREAGTAELWPFYYVFLSNFLSHHIPTLSPTWSLAVEEQYYMLWPLLLIVAPRRWLLAGIVGFALLYVVMITTGLAYRTWEVGPLLLRFSKLTYTAILLGAGLAILLHRRESFARLWPLLGWRWAPVFWTVVLLVEFATFPKTIIGLPQLIIHLTMTAIIGSVVIREDGPQMPVLRFPPIVRIGVVSYGIYLLHLLADHIASALVGRLFGGIEGYLAIYVLLFWGLAWIFAEISFRFYERPFLALRHKPLGFVARANKVRSAKENLHP